MQNQQAQKKNSFVWKYLVPIWKNCILSILVEANFFSEFTHMIKNNAGHCLIMHYEKFMYLIFIAGMELDIWINKSK